MKSYYHIENAASMKYFWPKTIAGMIAHHYGWSRNMQVCYAPQYVWWDTVCRWSWASYQIRRIAGCARACACAGNDGNVSPPPGVSNPNIHHGTCVTHVPWCMPGSLTSGFLWSMWRGKRSRHSRGAFATRNFTYLVRGLWLISSMKYLLGTSIAIGLGPYLQKVIVTKFWTWWLCGLR